MNTIRFTSKDAFVAALEDRRKFWQDYDRRVAREHQQAEMEWLRKARATLREALKFDYATLKEAIGYRGRLSLDDTPRCPVLMEAKIDSVLAALKHTQGKAFTVDSGSGTWKEAHSLLTWDPDAPTTVC